VTVNLDKLFPKSLPCTGQVAIVQPKPVQSSTINNFIADLAVDNTWTTCAATGVERGAWWKIVFESAKVVNGVTLNGLI
jgi:hypothetical protein